MDILSQPLSPVKSESHEPIIRRADVVEGQSLDFGVGLDGRPSLATSIVLRPWASSLTYQASQNSTQKTDNDIYPNSCGRSRHGGVPCLLH